ncbi:MAG: L,D-transpeptidase family protein [Lachnospirales bacterium]
MSSTDNKSEKSDINKKLDKSYAEDSALIDLIDIEEDTDLSYTEENISDKKIKDKKLKHSNKKTKHKKNTISDFKLLLAVTLPIIAVIIIAIISGHIYFSNRWYIDTVLNGTSVEGMKIENSISSFKKIYDDYSLTIKGRSDMSVTISKDDIDLVVKSDDCIKEAFEKQHEKFYLFAFLEPQNLEAAPEIEYSEEKFKNILENCELIKGSENKPIIAPVDAGAEFSDEKGYFVVRPEIEGNTLDKDEFYEIAKEALSLLIEEVNLDDANAFPNLFAAPDVKKEGSGLQEICDAYNKTVVHWFNWKMAEGHTVSLTPQDVMNWYDMDTSYNLTLNEQRVKDWVEKFCLKYKTVGKTRDFKNHAGNMVKVTGGDYGWQLNYDKTVKQVLDVLKTDNSENIKAYIENSSDENKEKLVSNFDAIYIRKGAVFDTNKDYSTTNYSEISISEQKVFVYKDGQLAYTANCITGLPIPARETTKGCWYVKERLRNKTLVGEDYRTPVSYWVRITWSGIGYHDATWQNWSAWSPERYKSVGSHGCVNLSMTDVAKIYDLVNVGDPVFVY